MGCLITTKYGNSDIYSADISLEDDESNNSDISSADISSEDNESNNSAFNSTESNNSDINSIYSADISLEDDALSNMFLNEDVIKEPMNFGKFFNLFTYIYILYDFYKTNIFLYYSIRLSRTF